LHSQSGNGNKLTYGTSVLHDGGADEFVDAVTVIVLADPLPVMVIVLADALAVAVLTLVTILVLVTVWVCVLVTVVAGQLAGLIHPPGQTRLPILH
jgi:hypothetical protein